jgi:hypothetical protein
MRQITKTLKDKEVLFVEVPKDAIGPTIGVERHTKEEILFFIHKENNMCGYTSLPPGNWQYICEASTATEEEAERVVEKAMFRNNYKDYYPHGKMAVDGISSFNTAKDSLQSLIKSVGIETENEYGEKPLHYDYDEMKDSGHYLIEIQDKRQKEIDLWQASQAKVWEKVIILINK